MKELVKLTKTWRRGFEVAAAASIYSTGPRLGMRLGAALYSGSSLISIGANNWYRTHPDSRHPLFAKNIHAEHAALLKRKYYDNSKNLTMYVYRSRMNNITKETNLGCSRPCLNCMALLRLSNVRRIRYINEAGVPEEMKIG